jgi:hypothetical protein
MCRGTGFPAIHGPRSWRDAAKTMSIRLTSAFIKVVPLRTLVLVAGSLALNACHSTGPDPNAAAYAAVASGTGDDFRTAIRDKVKMYQSGPQQMTGPDAVLEKGTLVRTIRKSFGYSLVQTAEGNQLGWVANEDLGSAPETAANP